MNLKGVSFVLALAAVAASADEVIFKSGDKLTGTVKSMDGGKMVFESKVAGELTLKMDDILTFSTEKPVALELKDGEKVSLPTATQTKDGGIASAPEGGKVYALADIAKVNPPPVKWTGSVSAGATFIRGNTHSDSEAVALDAARRTDRDRITVLGNYYFAEEADRGSSEDHTTADNWFIKGQYDYFLGRTKNYLYGNVKYEKDRIAYLDKRVSPGAGWGYQWFESPDFNLNTEAGGTWIYERYTDPDETRTYTAGRLAYHVDKSFNKAVKLYHNLEYIPSTKRIDTYLVNADAGLQASITSRLALDLKAQMAYNSQPAEDTKKTDTRYITSLVWKF